MLKLRGMVSIVDWSDKDEVLEELDEFG